MAEVNTRPSVALAIAGSGGAGVMTIGTILLEAAARVGYYGLMLRRFGPQVRGGESVALLQLSTRPIHSPPDTYDALIAIDWRRLETFLDEIPLAPESVIIGDPKHGEPPAAITAGGKRVLNAHFADVAAECRNARANVVALGAASALVGLPEEQVHAELSRRLHHKAAKARHSISHRSHTETAAAEPAEQPVGPEKAFEVGYRFGASLGASLRLDPADRNGAPMRGDESTDNGTRWLLSGNQALGLGALRGGVRFVAGYPITPATEIAEWLEPRLPQLGGTFVQAEDELAAITMVIGASFGGVPAMTVTSGPGLALMIESLGLATAAEVPALVVDVQRVGPSTGIPTKSEQADLNLAVYGAHGEAPRIVVAPTTIADCVPTTQWALELAETLQTPVVLLSDQQLGQSLAVVDAVPAPTHPTPTRALSHDPTAHRYGTTPTGVSPMVLPGTEGGHWVAEGLTHGESGLPSTAASDHLAQLAKRARKLAQHNYGAHWARCIGDGDLAVLTWGSATGATFEAVRRMHADSANLRGVALRLLAPLPTERLNEHLRGVRSVLVIEQNHGAQLYRLLRAFGEFPFTLTSYARPGPLPLRPGEIEQAIIGWRHAQ